ncbi:hypothetical protein G8759_14785 [Spirosoma aureum]|uniref:Uncharacterized protein n=1 Tax=Spirosoma aureum TaxID=2692134 RepID=A0A6G9AMZ4_9BACT|nr:hypothetical protein [Spirosoma aureum]QIP13788.1 hypothetical protein G8759_14785 [Spirosoma aureum]
MSCGSNNLSTSPLGRVYLANARMQDVEPTGDVSGVYYAFRLTVWEMIEVAPDPNSYVLAWNLIELYAKADLLEFELMGVRRQVKVDKRAGPPGGEKEKRQFSNRTGDPVVSSKSP